MEPSIRIRCRYALWLFVILIDVPKSECEMLGDKRSYNHLRSNLELAGLSKETYYYEDHASYVDYYALKQVSRTKLPRVKTGMTIRIR